jgi:hypothetical protein
VLGVLKKCEFCLTGIHCARDCEGGSEVQQGTESKHKGFSRSLSWETMASSGQESDMNLFVP